MTKKVISTVVWGVLGIVVFLPFPTHISQPLKIQFARSDGKPVEEIKVYQDWECFGFWGQGSEARKTDASGVVIFPARYGYGTVVTRLLGRAVTAIAVHASYGTLISVQFTLPSSLKVAFHPPAFTPREPFATSGRYLDGDSRGYLSQTSEDEREWVIVSGDFMTGKSTIQIPLEMKKPNDVLVPASKSAKPAASADTSPLTAVTPRLP